MFEFAFVFFFLCLAREQREEMEGKAKVMNMSEQWDICGPAETQKQVLTFIEIGPISLFHSALHFEKA